MEHTFEKVNGRFHCTKCGIPRTVHLTDCPNKSVTAEQLARIKAGRLDFRFERDTFWHDPRGWDPETSRAITIAQRM